MSGVKFVAEMSEHEQETATFGVGFKRDRDGNPIPIGRGSDEFWKTGHTDGLQTHLSGIRRSAEGGQGDAAVETELARINALRKQNGFSVLSAAAASKI
ncbi:hypothetical protein [Hyphomicrobium sulfonivorans]|uniref:hypothetical protein n=1 Tax=Hyphomicrobium sulfonivorans TaxID=121290 RepID=UPI00156EE71F|nr:hypothetical protein [Hyphomicrobium sulfonivorans]MBI1651162.1 hypothetical protein [Hyphomicrobium sulfonivorans]NSL72454.1 hypothetical protein [Hyphomicrobium sulfonivorans]